MSIVEFVKKELLSFTGLTINELNEKISKKQHKEEWLFWNPKTNTEINWFYKHSTAYLFANTSHVLNSIILNDLKQNSTILDFGGGSGNYSFTLVNNGHNCLYFDISIIQSEFVKYVSKKYNLPITVLQYNEEYIPIYNQKIDSVIALDVIEHIPEYNKYIRFFSDILNINGSVYIYAPFGTNNDPTHLDDSFNLHKIMKDNCFILDKTLMLNQYAECFKFVKQG